MKLYEILEPQRTDESLKSAAALLGAAIVAALHLQGCAAVPADQIPEKYQPQHIENLDKQSSEFITITHIDNAYARWRQFCRNYPGQCKPVSGKDVVPVDVADEVNSEKNGEIRYVGEDDKLPFSLGEDGKGVCSTYALAKRAELRKRGYSSKAMSFVVVSVDKTADHAVLLVHTDKGDLVLDNRHDHLVQLSKSYGVVNAIEKNNELYVVLPDIDTKVAKSGEKK